MAAALPVVSDAAGKAAAAVREEVKELGENPWATVRSWGTRILLTGILMTLSGYFLKKVGSAADADAVSTIAGISAIYGNVPKTESSVASWFSASTAYLVMESVPAGQLQAAADKSDGTNLPAPISVAISVLDKNGTPVKDANGLVWNALVFTTGTEYGKHGVSYGPTWNSQGGTPNPNDPASLDIPDAFSGFASDTNTYVIQVGITAPGFGTSQGGGGVDLSTVGISPNGSLPAAGSTNQLAGGFGPYVPYSKTPDSSPSVLGEIFGAIAGFGTAVVDTPKAIFASLIALPRLTADGIGWALGEGFGTLFWTIGPWLIGAGAVMLLAAWVGARYWPRLSARLELGVEARSARWWNRFDRWYKTRANVKEVRQEAANEALIASVVEKPVVEPAVVKAPALPPPELPPAPIVGQTESKPDAPVPEIGPSPPPADVLSPPEPEASKDPAEPTPAELEAQEKARLESMPPESPPSIDAGRPAEAQQTQPEKVGGEVSPTEVGPSPEPAPKPKKRRRKNSSSIIAEFESAWAAGPNPA